MKNKRFSFSTLITLIILAVALAISVTMMIAMRYFNRQVNAVTQKQALYTHINDLDTKVRTYYNSIDEEQLRNALAAGYVHALSDPYAQYFTPDEYQRALLKRKGQAAGVGLHVREAAENQLIVESVDADSAASKAGLMPQDILAAVNGEGVSASDCEKVQTLCDTSTEKITLSVLRDGKTLAFELTAYTYAVKSVYEQMLNDTVGYIRISAFYDNTLSQFKAAYSSLENSGATSFVFDVRGCSGGGSRSSLEGILAYLLPHGAYASYVSSNGTTENLVANDSHEMSVPSATLVNEETIGEAELFAGILQEFSMTTTVGQKTAGKGKLQDFIPLKDNNAALLLTVGEITLMRTGSIERVGIMPSTAVPLDADKKAKLGNLPVAEDDQLQAALATFSTNVLNTATTTAPLSAGTAATSADETVSTTVADE